MYFQCDSVVVAEDGSRYQPHCINLHECRCPSPSPSLDEDTQTVDEPDLKLWDEVVSEFGARQLSRVTDKLPASKFDKMVTPSTTAT